VPPEGPGGVGERAEERVDPEAVGNHLARPVARIRDPRQIRHADLLRIGDLNEPDLREVPAGGSPPLPETFPHREGGDQPHLLQLPHPVLAPPERPEAKARYLVGGEDLVLEQVEQDLKVSLVDCALARAILVLFCSNHDSGTALPPPSGRDLRRRGPVTWPFALPRPAPSRHLRAAAHGSGAARRRAWARTHTPSGRRIFSSCPCSPPSFPLARHPQAAG
jgi:hypothetical protein